MLLIKLTQREDGTVIAETPRGVLGEFPQRTIQEVAKYLVVKAEEVDEEIRIVDEFPDDQEERVNFHRLMKRRW
jgi:hypothetical protein